MSENEDKVRKNEGREESFEFAIDLDLQDPETGTNTTFSIKGFSISFLLYLTVFLAVIWYFWSDNLKNKFCSYFNGVCQPEAFIVGKKCEVKNDSISNFLNVMKSYNKRMRNSNAYNLFGQEQPDTSQSIQQRILSEVILVNAGYDGAFQVVSYVDNKKEVQEVEVKKGELKTIYAYFYVESEQYKIHMCRWEVHPKKSKFWLSFKRVSIKITVSASKKIRR